MWDPIVSVPDHCLSFYFDDNLSPLGILRNSRWRPRGQPNIGVAILNIFLFWGYKIVSGVKSSLLKCNYTCIFPRLKTQDDRQK